MSIAELEPQVHASRPIMRLHPGLNGILMSIDEFESIDDWERGYRYEIIHGVLVVSPPPDDAGQGPNERLGNWLWDYQQRHPSGKVLDDSLMERPVRTKVGIRVVDRALWIGFGRPIKSRRDKATILVEFVSLGKRAALRDYEDKRDEYLEMGAKEYWIIDRFRRTMTVYFQKPANPAERIVKASETYTTPLLPGFELLLKRLLDLADQYADDEGA
ncbi:MAG: Uma2 family endonuclease [Planctomycetaceae bacterium]|nr:Uma2 family endonuclease [Planctomycetaceae bacterium]